jgi:hypothetical protein
VAGVVDAVLVDAGSALGCVVDVVDAVPAVVCPVAAAYWKYPSAPPAAAMPSPTGIDLVATKSPPAISAPGKAYQFVWKNGIDFEICCPATYAATPTPAAIPMGARGSFIFVDS